jgi:hypothetical protein
MPNGRSGSLFLGKDDLAQWLSGLEGSEIVGISIALLVAGRSPGVSVESVAGLLASCRADRVAVEEQDNHDYIIHLDCPLGGESTDNEKWVLVSPDSPLFEELRREHKRQGQWSAGL